MRHAVSAVQTESILFVHLFNIVNDVKHNKFNGKVFLIKAIYDTITSHKSCLTYHFNKKKVFKQGQI